MAEPVDAGPTAGPADRRPNQFVVRLSNFEGPFDLLLGLIGRRKLDVTEISLSQVTDDFLGYVNRFGSDWDLDQATQFLVVAATLLDLKTARLLPSPEIEADDDIAVLEARDLLFARLLQYRAFKLSAAHLAELMRRNARRYPRTAGPQDRFAALAPEVELGIDADQLARLAVQAFAPRPQPVVALEHVHTVRVSVAEHVEILTARLRIGASATFAALVADCATTLEVVARFLGLLELYRSGALAFEQPVALDELTVRWVGAHAATGVDSGGPTPVPVRQHASVDPRVDEDYR